MKRRNEPPRELSRAEAQGLLMLVAIAFFTGLAFGVIGREIHEEAKAWGMAE